MSVRQKIVCVVVVGIVAAAGLVSAQMTETLEIKRGTVVSVWDNDLVVKMMDGATRHVEVPEGFTFMVNGEELPVSALKPGMNLTAIVVTATAPVEVQTTEVKKGQVLSVAGRTVVIRSEEGTKKYTVPGDFPFWVDGQKKTVYDLRKGNYVTAEIVHTSVEMVTETEAVVAASEPAKPAAPAAPAAPRAAAKTEMRVLPKTGSSLPIFALAGGLLLLIGIGIGIIRRF